MIGTLTADRCACGRRLWRLTVGARWREHWYRFTYCGRCDRPGG